MTHIECGWIKTSNYLEIKEVTVDFKPKYYFIAIGYDLTLGVYKWGDVMSCSTQNLQYITVTDNGFKYQALDNGVMYKGCYYFLATDE